VAGRIVLATGVSKADDYRELHLSYPLNALEIQLRSEAGSHVDSTHRNGYVLKKTKLICKT
jgi:hypothetical protein